VSPQAYALVAQDVMVTSAVVHGLGTMGEADVTKALEILRNKPNLTTAFLRSHTHSGHRTPYSAIGHVLPGL